MRNMAVLHSPAFSYPLPVLVRVLFNLLIFKGKILYYNKYSDYPYKNLFRESNLFLMIYHSASFLYQFIFYFRKPSFQYIVHFRFYLGSDIPAHFLISID